MCLIAQDQRGLERYLRQPNANGCLLLWLVGAGEIDLASNSMQHIAFSDVYAKRHALEPDKQAPAVVVRPSGGSRSSSIPALLFAASARALPGRKPSLKRHPSSARQSYVGTAPIDDPC